MLPPIPSGHIGSGARSDHRKKGMIATVAQKVAQRSLNPKLRCK
jgi:hypothetical protein